MKDKIPDKDIKHIYKFTRHNMQVCSMFIFSSIIFNIFLYLVH